MTEDKANELINNLCKEVYNSNGSCLVLVGDWADGELHYSVRGCAGNVYVLDAMVQAIQKYQQEQQEQHTAIDENGIPHLTGIQVDKEMEKDI